MVIEGNSISQKNVKILPLRTFLPNGGLYLNINRLIMCIINQSKGYNVP